MAKKNGRIRKDVALNQQVQIVLKQDQKNGHLTKGVVAEILTNAAKHPHGIKVRLKSGKIGRVQKILSSLTPYESAKANAAEESATRDKVGGHLKFLDY